MENQAIRLTKQRQAVLDALCSTDAHPDAAWVYQEVRKDIPQVSLGTVYRSLAVLVRAGLVRELPHRGKVLYDANLKPHHHAVCIACGGIFDVELPSLDHLCREAQRRTGFHQIDSCRLDFYGLCQCCTGS